MRLANKTISITFIAWMAFSGASLTQASHPECDTRFVQTSGSKVVVAPSAPIQLDAENLQCALLLANHRKLPTVALMEGEYDLRQRVEVSGFSGTLTGNTIATTHITGCSGSRGGISFKGGSPTVTRMTLDSRGRNCTEQILVTTSDDACGGSTTVFVKLDRLLFLSDHYNDDSAFVVAPPASCVSASQPDTKLLGKVLVNRVELSGEYDVGAKISMAAGAQVDIFFSDISGRDAGIQYLNTGSNAQIVSSTVEASKRYSAAILIKDYPGFRRSANVLNVSSSSIIGYGDGIFQDCSVKCFVNISDTSITASFGSPISTTITGAFRVFDSSIRGDGSIIFYNNSVMANNDIKVFAIPDIRLLGSGNTINQPDNDVYSPAGSNNLVSSRN